MMISRLIRNHTRRIEQAADALDEKRDEHSYDMLLMELSLLLRTSEVVLAQGQREFGEGTGVWDLLLTHGRIDDAFDAFERSLANGRDLPQEFIEAAGISPDLDKKQFESFQEQISVFALSEIQKKRLEHLANQVAKTDV